MSEKTVLRRNGYRGSFERDIMTNRTERTEIKKALDPETARIPVIPEYDDIDPDDFEDYEDFDDDYEEEEPKKAAPAEPLEDPYEDDLVEEFEEPKETAEEEIDSAEDPEDLYGYADEDPWADEFGFEEMEAISNERPRHDLEDAPEARKNTSEDDVSFASFGWYLGHALLFTIPVIGLIAALITYFAGKKKGTKSFALAWVIYTLIVLAAVSALIYFGVLDVPLGRA